MAAIPTAPPKGGSRKKNAEALRSGYTWKKRSMEIASTIVFLVLLYLTLKNILTSCDWTATNFAMFFAAYMVSLLFGDFYSGVIHWSCDTWGTLETPVFGKTFIRSFREHHIDPSAICNHDIIETNGDNLLIAIPFLYVLAKVDLGYNDVPKLFSAGFLVGILIWVALTNQIHQWAHQTRASFIVRTLQNTGLLLGKKHHQVHHKNPFDRYYCITNGWLNPHFRNIGFWRSLESVISYATGLIPRIDDQEWAQASFAHLQKQN